MFRAIALDHLNEAFDCLADVSMVCELIFIWVCRCVKDNIFDDMIRRKPNFEVFLYLPIIQ